MGVPSWKYIFRDICVLLPAPRGPVQKRRHPGRPQMLSIVAADSSSSSSSSPPVKSLH
uniref:Uncharacterized protein n=1 Tax=Anguilla anguilla TaxID=7936 RepID=A0A0E9XS14_ANGAN